MAGRHIRKHDEQSNACDVSTHTNSVHVVLTLGTLPGLVSARITYSVEERVPAAFNSPEFASSYAIGCSHLPRLASML